MDNINGLPYSYIPCNKSNYGANRGHNIKHLVIHYTANNGDTAEGNGNYFKNNKVGASAHYFVDNNSVVQSVYDSFIAWHCESKGMTLKCGCRNSNSIGIEMCSRKDSNGKYYFDNDTIKNAVIVAKYIMNLYNIPISNVIRHYDVCGKNCPAPFVENTTAWNNFKKALTQQEVKEMTEAEIIELIKKHSLNANDVKNIIASENKTFKNINDIPTGLQTETKQLIDAGALKGDDKGLNIKYDTLRAAIIAKRYIDSK